MDEIGKLRELTKAGSCCAQIMAEMGLYLRGEENGQLVEALSALCGGVCTGAGTCGALTGAACTLALFDADAAKSDMIPELVEWFEDEYGERYDGIRCLDILENDKSSRSFKCPELIENTYLKMRGLLAEFGYLSMEE